MADESGGRRFSREETALILRRATEGEQRVAARAEAALTLDEIVAAAREAGIDVGAVRRAAALSRPPTAPLQGWVVGAAVDPLVEASFPGALKPEQHAAARRAIEEAIGRPGEIGAIGPSFVWREEHGFGRTEVGASVASGTVEVSAQAERGGHLLALVSAIAILVGAVMLPLGGFAGLVAAGGPLLAILGPIAAIYLTTRIVWPAVQRPVIRRLEAAVLEVGALVEKNPTEGGAP